MADKSVNGFKKLSKFLELQKKQFPEVQKRFMIIETGNLVENIVRRTPVDTGRLRGAWKAQIPVLHAKKWTLSCSNNVEYAEYVEYGHRWVKRGFITVKLEDYNPETDKTGFTKGRFMARDGIKQTKKELPQKWAEHVEKWLKLFEKVK